MCMGKKGNTSCKNQGHIQLCKFKNKKIITDMPTLKGLATFLQIDNDTVMDINNDNMSLTNIVCIDALS